MSEGKTLYRPGLASVLRSTAAAYGYALTVATTVATLTSTHAAPGVGDLYLFIAGGALAFALLEALLALLGSPEPELDRAYPLAGVLNVVSVVAAFSAATGVAHLVDGTLAWLLAPLAATIVYLAVVAGQVAAVARFVDDGDPSAGAD